MQAPSAAERPSRAPSTCKVLPRWSGILVVMVLSSSPLGEQLCVSINDEAKIALDPVDGIDAGGEAVDPVDAPEQRGLGIGCRRKSVIGPRQLFLRDRADDIGRHENHQFGLVIDEVLAAEQRAQNRQLVEPRQALDGLLGLLLDQAGHRYRAAGGYFQRGLGTAGLDRGNGCSALAASQSV